jgi:hypothetical protein
LAEASAQNWDGVFVGRFGVLVGLGGVFAGLGELVDLLGDDLAGLDEVLVDHL